MHHATKIAITRAEGPTELCRQGKVFEGPDCWEAASSWLFSQGHTFPATGGYDKHDFEVIWDDGETYEGRLDCQHPDCKNPDLDVAEHVRDFLELYAGIWRPAHLTNEQWTTFLKWNDKDRPAFVKFLSEYAIPARSRLRENRAVGG
jgi:hypothetical protein